MSKVLIITGDGAGQKAEYGLFRMREEHVRATVARVDKEDAVHRLPSTEARLGPWHRAPMVPAPADAAFDAL